MVVDDHPAIAIENLAARREHRNGLDAVLARAPDRFRVADLQVPESGDQEQETPTMKYWKKAIFQTGT